MSTTPKPNIVAFTVGKGGAAKTTTTAALDCVLEQQGIKRTLYSLEVHGERLKRLRPESKALRYSESAIADASTDLDQLFAAGQKGHVLVDAGANTERGLLDWIESTDFVELGRQHNMRIVFLVLLVGGTSDCVDRLRRLQEFIGSSATWFAALSPVGSGSYESIVSVCGKPPEGATKGARAAELPIKPTLIRVPRVPARVLDLCYAHGVPVTSTNLPESVDVLSRARIRTVGKQFADELAPLIRLFFE